MSILSRFKPDTIGFSRIKVPGNKKAQKILSFFHIKASPEDELGRIELAKEVCSIWRKEKIDFPLPAVPEKEDYWYLIQLFSLNRHVHFDKKPYLYDLGKSEEIFIEDFLEVDYDLYQKSDNFQPASIIDLLFHLAKKKGLNLVNIDLTNPTRILSRDNIDKLLFHCGDYVIEQIGLDPNKHKLINIPFDIYIRLLNKMNFGKYNLNTHFDGYRLRTDGKIMGLFGGNIKFGGSSFIDSFWTDTHNFSIVTRFVIIRKDYGY